MALLHLERIGQEGQAPLQNHLLQQNLQQQLNQMSLQQMQLGLGYHQNPMSFQSQQTVIISLQQQQAQKCLN